MTWLQKSRNKFNAKRTEFNGHTYDSKLEAAVAQDLDLRLKAGDLVRVDRQVTIPLMVNGMKVGQYRIDFIAMRRDGTQEYVEAKGFETMLWRLKWKILEAMMKDKDDVEMIVIKR